MIERDGDAARRSTSDLDIDRLAGWCRANVAGFSGPLTCTRFAGGQSNPTYRLDAASGRYVLRRRPFGPLLPSAHAVDREYALLSRIHATGYPVPRVLALCTDEHVLGAVFYVMALVEGETFWVGSLPDRTPGERAAIYLEMTDRLAQLHDIDPDAAGLDDFRRPGSYLERQVARWTRQYRLSQTEDLADAEKLIAWLPTAMPREGRTSLLHGDWRIDNLIFHRDRPGIAAVLDWELSALGDPLADLSYFLMSWFTPPSIASGLQGLAGSSTGIPTAEAVVERYRSARGLADLPDLDWYHAFSRFRQLGIAQGIRKRLLEGTASSAHAAEAGSYAPALAASGWAFARQAGAAI